MPGDPAIRLRGDPATRLRGNMTARTSFSESVGADADAVRQGGPHCFLLSTAGPHSTALRLLVTVLRRHSMGRFTVA